MIKSTTIGLWLDEQERSTNHPMTEVHDQSKGIEPQTNLRRNRPSKPPVLGVGDKLGAGDSYLVTDILPSNLADDVFTKLKDEVKWQVMHHRGGEVPRLVAVEGEVGPDGSFPVYRHPADESPPLLPFSPTVSLIREHVQKIVQHPVNHVLIQFYRSGKDFISDHSDKTIDVVRGSNIVNVSMGAQRVMTLKLKKEKTRNAEKDQVLGKDEAAAAPSANTPAPPRPSQKIPLPHNSMLVMGLETNVKWLHGINHDNRPFETKAQEEQREEGGRISLTFRHIGTFLSKDETLIWGQGAKGKLREQAEKVTFDQDEVERLLIAFGDENQQSGFDWDKAYGSGFDVLHLTSKDPEVNNVGPPS